MKRCILVDLRTNKDDKSGDELMFLTLVRLPSKMSNGGLWHPRTNEMMVNVCINKRLKPEDYEQFLKVNPGALFDITFGINDFNNKTFVATCVLVKNSNKFTPDELYL